MDTEDETNKLLDRMREIFGIIKPQAEKRGESLDKPRESTIVDSSVFAADDEVPTIDEYGDFYATYTPFSWKPGNGKQRFGFLIRGANNGKIYGLETDDGTCLTASAVKKMMQKMATDGKSSFSKPVSNGLRTYHRPAITMRFSVFPNGKEGDKR